MRLLPCAGLSAAFLALMLPGSALAQTPSQNTPWSVEATVGWDFPVSGNILSAAIGRVFDQPTVIDAQSYGDVYGTGVAYEFGAGYMLDDRNEVRGDPTILRRVFDNLLGNALEHSPQGGRILVNVVSCDEGVEITVADQGPGVPEAFRERIFEKFQRLENRKTVPGANRGLGLTFCRLAIVFITMSPLSDARSEFRVKGRR